MAEGIRLSNSKANTWRRCPKQYEFKYVHKLRKKQRTRPLELGTWMHEILENWYVGKPWIPEHKKRVKAYKNLFAEEREELGDLPNDVIRLFTSYLRKYAKQDAKLKIVDSELDEIVPLANGDEFNFIIDLIVEEDGGLWLWDHKFLKKFMDADFMLLDAQLTRYFWAAKKMGYDTPDCPLRGVIFNEVRTKAPSVPNLNKNGKMSVAACDTDYYTALQAIRDYGLDSKDYVEFLKKAKFNTSTFFRRTRMIKDDRLTLTQMNELLDTSQEIKAGVKRERFPRSVTKQCVWDCDYKDLCVTQLMGGDTSSLIKANFERSKRRGGV